MIVPKSQQMIGSDDVLFFYVGRRYQTVGLTHLGLPYNFTQLPTTVMGTEQINETEVEAPPYLPFAASGDNFTLRSIVTTQHMATVDGRKYSVSNALISNPDHTLMALYDPIQPSIVAGYKPMGTTTSIDAVPAHVNVKKYGTIFIYQKEKK